MDVLDEFRPPDPTLPDSTSTTPSGCGPTRSVPLPPAMS